MTKCVIETITGAQPCWVFPAFSHCTMCQIPERGTPDLFAEYRERGFNWPEQRQTRQGEIEPPAYWGWKDTP